MRQWPTLIADLRAALKGLHLAAPARRALVLFALLPLGLVGAGCHSTSVADSTAVSTVSSWPVSTESAPSTTLDEIGVNDLALSTGFDDPSGVDLPLRQRAELRTWFDDQGVALIKVTAIASQLAASGASRCSQVADDLDGLGSPESLASLAHMVPDAVAREVMSGLQRAIAELLSTCVDGTVDSNTSAALAWQWVLADRMLRDLGVIR